MRRFTMKAEPLAAPTAGQTILTLRYIYTLEQNIYFVVNNLQ